jgi:hypothetical protein
MTVDGSNAKLRVGGAPSVSTGLWEDPLHDPCHHTSIILCHSAPPTAAASHCSQGGQGVLTARNVTQEQEQEERNRKQPRMGKQGRAVNKGRRGTK